MVPLKAIAGMPSSKALIAAPTVLNRPSREALVILVVFMPRPSSWSSSTSWVAAHTPSDGRGLFLVLGGYHDQASSAGWAV